jgi:hypothetical protein
MAKPTFELIQALRTTANNLRNGAYHSWGHHGACNCGNLVQTVTCFTREEIRRHAQQSTGEWTELALEFCPVTNAPLALIFSRLESLGLSPTDIHHIEYLSDPTVLKQLPGGHRWLKRNNKEDAIIYFETFASVLEDVLLSSINIEIDQNYTGRPSGSLSDFTAPRNELKSDATRLNDALHLSN